MKNEIIAIYDKKAKNYMQIQTMPTILTLARNCQLAYPENHPIRQYADEFAVYKLGSIDTDTGEIIPEKAQIAEMKDLLNQMQDELEKAKESK